MPTVKPGYKVTLELPAHKGFKVKSDLRDKLEKQDYKDLPE